MDYTIRDRLINFRHELHQYPEIGFEEFETRRRIKGMLAELGLANGRTTAHCPLCGLERESRGLEEASVWGRVVDGRGQPRSTLPIQDIRQSPYRAFLDLLLIILHSPSNRILNKARRPDLKNTSCLPNIHKFATSPLNIIFR